MLLITLQELTESGKSEAPVMDVLTFLQRPVERIQTYQALLKVSMLFYFHKYVYKTVIVNCSVIAVIPEIYYSLTK